MHHRLFLALAFSLWDSVLWYASLPVLWSYMELFDTTSLILYITIITWWDLASVGSPLCSPVCALLIWLALKYLKELHDDCELVYWKRALWDMFAPAERFRPRSDPAEWIDESSKSGWLPFRPLKSDPPRKELRNDPPSSVDLRLRLFPLILLVKWPDFPSSSLRANSFNNTTWYANEL